MTEDEPVPTVPIRPPKRERDPATGAYVEKINDALIDAAVYAVTQGASIESAAGYVGISRATMFDWLGIGRRELEAAPDLDHVSPGRHPYARLASEIYAAFDQFKVTLLGSIQQHGKENWQAHAWLLERKFPDEFGRRQRIEHSQPEGESFRVTPTPVFDPSKLTPEELDTAIMLLEKARPDGMQPLIERHPVIEQRTGTED
jgi:hypothetical protein